MKQRLKRRINKVVILPSPNEEGRRLELSQSPWTTPPPPLATPRVYFNISVYWWHVHWCTHRDEGGGGGRVTAVTRLTRLNMVQFWTVYFSEIINVVFIWCKNLLTDVCVVIGQSAPWWQSVVGGQVSLSSSSLYVTLFFMATGGAAALFFNFYCYECD